MTILQMSSDVLSIHVDNQIPKLTIPGSVTVGSEWEISPNYQNWLILVFLVVFLVNEKTHPRTIVWILNYDTNANGLTDWVNFSVLYWLRRDGNRICFVILNQWTKGFCYFNSFKSQTLHSNCFILYCPHNYSKCPISSVYPFRSC